MSKTILLVDDEPDVVDLIKNRLEANQYTVMTAQDGHEALEKIYAHKPDLIVLDIMMPGISGYDVCERIKHDPDVCHIPVFILTAKIRYKDKKEGEHCGADAYITKPYSSDLLLDQIRRTIG